MKVSVVVPCFNHERYVRACLAAIDAQTHQDLEVIIVDDGSTDGTWEAIRGFDWKRPGQVRAYRTSNRGAHAALNFAIDQASGEFIAPCNSDDAFTPARVEKLLEAAVQTKSRFLFSRVQCVDEAGVDITLQWPYARDLRTKQDAIASFPSVGFSLVLTNVAISTGNFFFHRSLVDEIGYFRPYRYCHDWDFILRALTITEPVYVPETLYAYRLHAHNSFLALAEVAGQECPELMRRYLKAAHAEQPRNRLAPAPANWPVFFDVFIQEHAYQPYLCEWEKVDGVRYFPPKEEREADIRSEHTPAQVRVAV